jgi:hypothetical protein
MTPLERMRHAERLLIKEVEGRLQWCPPRPAIDARRDLRNLRRRIRIATKRGDA